MAIHGRFKSIDLLAALITIFCAGNHCLAQNAASCTTCLPDTAEQFYVINRTLVSSARLTRTGLDYTYRVDVHNAGPAATDVRATVASKSPDVVVADSEIEFGTNGPMSGQRPRAFQQFCRTPTLSNRPYQFRQVGCMSLNLSLPITQAGGAARRE
jgi:hypothetical protein